MKVITENFKDSIVFTVSTGGVVERWAPAVDRIQESGMKKMFTLTKEIYVSSKSCYEITTKKVVLVSDRGTWFNGDDRWTEGAKVAEHCRYKAEWYGEFPYGSWAIAIRQCSETNKVSWSEFSTDINPRGLSDAERWEERCQEYKPELVAP